MDCYKQMYYQLFNQVTDIITALEVAQQQAEEIFLAAPPSVIYMQKDSTE